MRESVHHLQALCHRVVLGAMPGAPPARRFTSGFDALDARLDGGLAQGRIHEICAGDAVEASQASAFAGLMAARASPGGKTILWLRTEQAERRSGRVYGPGLAALGLDPRTLVLVVARDDEALLQATVDAARCAGLGAVIAECWRNPRALDLTASRRLMLAAEASGVTVFLLRIDAAPSANACDTRWAVRSAPSAALAANAPGRPALDIELLRRRAGPAGGTWRMEWDRDAQLFRDPALSGAVVRFPAGGPLARPADARRRAG